MKNGLIDLNDHLFSQLERLGDEQLTDDQLQIEVKRSKAVIGIADKVISNGQLLLRAAELRAEYQTSKGVKLPAMLEAPANSVE